MSAATEAGVRTTFANGIADAWANRRAELIVTLASALVLTTGFRGLDARSFWLDEATTFYVSDVSWTRMFQIFLGAEHGWHPPTYFIALKAWREIFGDTQVAIRALSVVFAAASVPATYLVARRLTDRWTAVLAAVLIACNAYVVQYAQEARTYTLVMLLTILSYWLLLRALESTTAWRWAAFGAVATLGVYSHFFFGLIVLAQAAAVALPAMRPRALRGPIIGFGLLGLLTAPLAMGALLESGSVLGWVPPIQGDSLRRLIHAYSGGTPATLVGYVIGALLALAWIIGPSRWRWSALVLLWVLLPPALLAAASLVKPLFILRYLIVSLPALVILVSYGLTRVPSRAAVVLAGVLVATSLIGVADWYGVEHRQFRETAAFIRQHGTEKDGVVLSSNGLHKPLAFQMSQPAPGERLPELVTPARPWDWNPYATADEPNTGAMDRFKACVYERVWVVGGPKNIERAASETVVRVLGAAYDRADTVRIGDMGVHEYVRNEEPCPPAP